MVDYRSIVSALVDMLGAKITAAVGGASKTSTVRQWMTGEQTSTHMDALLVAFNAARSIAERDTKAVAQRWFVGTNHILGQVSPIEVLRENTAEGRANVLLAADRFNT